MARMIRLLAGHAIDEDRNSFIALYLDRTVNMLVAMLAVMKAGAAYVPIVPDKSTERTAMVLEDADPALVIVNSHYQATIEGLTNAPTISVESVDDSLLSTNLTEVERSGSDLIYMIYTSGKQLLVVT